MDGYSDETLLARPWVSQQLRVGEPPIDIADVMYNLRTRIPNEELGVVENALRMFK